MKASCVLLLTFCLAAFSVSAAGQQAGENIGVLPVVSPESDPNYFYTGDGNLQRQVEPTLAVSTRNPNHLAAFYIDYRTVDVPDDLNVGGGGASFASNLLSAFTGFFAKLFGRPESSPVPVAAALGEANIGYSRSYDGALTWSGALLPGLSFDNVPSPIKTYAATTDPVAAAGPCGSIYVAFVAFTRGSASAIAVAKFADLDDSTTGAHTIAYKGMSILATGNNSTNGPFNDKVAIAVDIDRSGAGGCGHRVYVTHTEFDGLDKSGKFQSKAYLTTRAFANETSSLDGVTGWTRKEISGSYTQNQGTTLAVDPLNGDLYVFWRHFFKPHTILFAKASAANAALGRLSKPLPLFTDAMATFDQPGVSIASGSENLAFRSNAFPTAAVAVDSTNKSRVFVAWQERVGSSGSPATVGGSPRIVLTSSSNAGTSWTARKAVDMAYREPETAGLGFANGSGRPSYPQVMPSLSFGGGQLMLAYSEARGEVGPSGYITAYNRIVDHRGAVLDRVTGAFVKSFQISRYPIKPWAASPSTSNTISDLEPVNPPCSPDFGEGLPLCVPRINRIVPQSAGGTIAFMGDYNWLTSSVPFVPNGSGGWKWGTQAEDVPWVGGHTVFADNRNLVPPTYPSSAAEWNRYVNYAPPGSSLCTNAGSRNTDVLTSRLSLGLLVTAPLVFRETPAEFPFTVWNQTDQKKFFRLSIETAAANVGFGKPGTAFASSREGIVQVLPYSSSSHVVYINESGQPKVTVKVTEVADYPTNCSPNCDVTSPLTGQITFNAETTHPPLTAAGNTKAIEVSNPFPENPFPENPFPENPFPENPFPENPFPENPFPENTAVEDVSWTVTAPTALSADTVAAYAALIGIDKAYWPNYGFQLIISKPSTTGVFANCDPAFNVPQGTIISNYFLPSLETANPFPENPFPENPFPENPFPENPFPENPFPENSAFTIAPSDTGSTATFSTFSASTSPTEAPPAVELYKITLRAYKKPGAESNPNFVPFNPERNPPSAKIVEKNCTPGTSDCFLAESPSPELYVVSPDDTPTTGAPDLGEISPNPVSAGQTIALSGSPSVKNDGLLPASDRTHGYFLVPSSCALPTWGSKLDGDTIPDCAALLDEQPFVDPNLLDVGSSEALFADLTIPLATPPGWYRLLIYADYRREVSERDETNNWALSQPFEITPPRYEGILGLFSPCSGATCERNAGPALPLAFQLTYDGVTPVDSSSTEPRLTIFAPVGQACQTNLSVLPAFVADPTNVSAGSSLWQYFDATCAPVGANSCPRDAFTHQYNWQTKDPETGVNLPLGCYTVVVEVEGTNQTIGSIFGPVARLEVTLR